MEECIEHFSHEHQLRLFEVDADEDPKPYRCSICGLPILSTPSYTCNVDANCNFFLHKPCTQLPQKFYHQLHQQNLFLRKPLNEKFRNFAYTFWDDSRKLDVHPLVAQPGVEIKSRHRSHIAHPLVVFCREIMCRCDVCGEEEKGFFYYCKECGFFIHQDCTMLPSVVKLPSHPHPYILAYSLPYVPYSHYSSPNREYNNSCGECFREWRLPDGGIYFCGECYSLAHVTCAKPCMINVLADTEFVHLPEEEDTFPRLAIRRFLEKNVSSCQNTIKIENKKVTTKYHKHPLILEDACSSSSSSECDDTVCDICIQPIIINRPLYRCDDCDFVAHRICVDHLPANFELSFGPVRVEGQLVVHDELAKSYFNSVFRCVICRRPSNGISYKFTESGRLYYKSDVDLECAAAPKTVMHASHKQHILFQTGNRWFSETNCKLSCCSRFGIFNGIYRCVVCDYSIHIRCALLPKKTPHKFDEHPLELIMTEEKQTGQFCEVCEQQIELKWWYYGCRKCKQYFHINCIPSVGLMSKVKFGKTTSTHLDDQLHCHPLLLTRMLTHQRHERCALCNKIIQGFSDDHGMAFQCSTSCHFWIHFSCAAATTKYSDYTKE